MSEHTQPLGAEGCESSSAKTGGDGEGDGGGGGGKGSGGGGGGESAGGDSGCTGGQAHPVQSHLKSVVNMSHE